MPSDAGPWFVPVIAIIGALVGALIFFGISAAIEWAKRRHFDPDTVPMDPPGSEDFLRPYSIEFKINPGIPGMATEAINCRHAHSHFDPKGWPTGEDLEICDDCGASRTHWEQGQSAWVHFELTIEEERAQLEQCFADLRNGRKEQAS